MEIRVIKNRADYDRTLKDLSNLMDKEISPGSQDENTLELLLLVIKDYEQKVIDPIATDPIEAIKFRMDQMQYTRKDLVPLLGSISRVSEVLSGKRHLSLAMIRKLHEKLGIPLESLVCRKTIHRRTSRNIKPRRSVKSRKKSFS